MSSTWPFVVQSLMTVFLFACGEGLEDETFQIGTTVEDMEPVHGSAAGGDRVVLRGVNVDRIDRVTLDGVESTFSSRSPDRIEIATPAHPPGLVRIEAYRGDQQVFSRRFGYFARDVMLSGLNVVQGFCSADHRQSVSADLDGDDDGDVLLLCSPGILQVVENRLGSLRIKQTVPLLDLGIPALSDLFEEPNPVDENLGILSTGDVNKDGFRDVLIAGTRADDGTGLLAVALGNTTGAGGPALLVPLAQRPLGAPEWIRVHRPLVTGDFDENGELDIALTTVDAKRNVYLTLLSQNAGHFEESIRLIAPSDPFQYLDYASLYTVDLDRDDVDDLLVTWVGRQGEGRAGLRPAWSLSLGSPAGLIPAASGMGEEQVTVSFFGPYGADNPDDPDGEDHDVGVAMYVVFIEPPTLVYAHPLVHGDGSSVMKSARHLPIRETSVWKAYVGSGETLFVTKGGGESGAHPFLQPIAYRITPPSGMTRETLPVVSPWLVAQLAVESPPKPDTSLPHPWNDDSRWSDLLLEGMEADGRPRAEDGALLVSMPEQSPDRLLPNSAEFLTLADTDGDGDQDVAVLRSDAWLAILEQDARTLEPLSRGVDIEEGLPSDPDSSHEAVAIDWDQDGDEEIALLAPQNLLVFDVRRAEIVAVAGWEITADVNTTLEPIADLGDGLPALLLSGPESWLFTAAGGLALRLEVAESQSALLGDALSDLDLDGLPDLLVHGRGADQSGTFIAWGTWDAGHLTFEEPELLSSSELTRVIAAVDLDLDGNRDLVAVDGDRRIEVFFGSGDRQLQHRQTLESQQGPLSVCDLDGDGFMELVVSDSAPPTQIRFYRQHGSPSEFLAAGMVASGHGPLFDGRREPSLLRCSDLDGDGLADVLDNRRILWNLSE